MHEAVLNTKKRGKGVNDTSGRAASRLLGLLVRIRLGSWICLLWVLCVVRGLCYEPIPRPEESYRMRFVTACGIQRRQSWPELSCCAREREREYLNLSLWPLWMYTEWLEVQLKFFLTSSLNVYLWEVSHMPLPLHPAQNNYDLWTEGWAGTRVGLGILEKGNISFFCLGLNPERPFLSLVTTPAELPRLQF